MAAARRFRAAWVLPIAGKPLPHGTITVEDGRIVDVGEEASDAVDLGSVALLPGLVNAHTHLELSHLQGLVPPSRSFGPWVRAVLTARSQPPSGGDVHILTRAREQIEKARRTGTVLFGDVSNTLVTVPLLKELDVPAHVFYELIGFTEPAPDERVQAARAAIDALGQHPDVRLSLAPHAPYSVSAALFKAIRADLDAHAPVMTSVHLGENPDEVSLLRSGTGEFRSILESLGRWPEAWEPPGVSPVGYLSNLGFLDSRVLVVHGVQFDGEDLTRLRALGVTLVSCPRSNVHVGVGPPPLEAFYAMDVDVAFGTDSLASVADLEMFNELAEARRIAPRVPASSLLRSATDVGARALGFGDEFGTLESGKRAEILAVRIPENVDDVEEYLVSGIPAGDISWLA